MREYHVGGLLASLALITGACGDDGAVSVPPPPPVTGELALETVATGLDTPVFLTAPPGDGDRLFVVEKTGAILIIRGGAVLGQPFLDLSNSVSGASEQGLLGLAFAPDYANSGLFVVNYTDRAGDTQVAAFTVSQNPDRADPASEVVLLTVPQPFPNHNGGMVAFGPDGHLYIATGDGGSGGDPQGHGQNRATLLGGMLRVALSPAGVLTVPADNPFVGEAGVRPELWSYGLRNPWRFSFDRTTGDLYVADVGQNRREEIDVSTAADGAGRGLNFGWNIMEGSDCFSPAAGCDQTGLQIPIVEYDHGQGCSVTGGYVYRGSAAPVAQGTYFYGDYCSGWVRSFRLVAGQATDPREWTDLAPGGQITSFGEDPNGELYILTAEGRVARIVPN